MYNWVEMIFEEMKQGIIRWLNTCDAYVRYRTFNQTWNIWKKVSEYSIVILSTALHSSAYEHKSMCLSNSSGDFDLSSSTCPYSICETRM